MKLNTLQQMESHNGSTGKETPPLTEITVRNVG